MKTVGGKRPVGPYQCLRWAKGPAQGKPLLGDVENPPRHGYSQG